MPQKGRGRRGALELRVWLLLSVLLVATSGCFTTLGYIPDNLKTRHLSDQERLTPTYKEVKQWAYDVQDAYGSRATTNRYATYFGALFAAAAAGSMAGLAVFSSGSAAIAGIPIGAAFLSGTAAIYNNSVRADMYGRASAYVKRLIDISDERIGKRPAGALQAEARCLKMEVDKVMWLVDRHLTMMEPQNVVAALAAIGNVQASAAGQAPSNSSLQRTSVQPPSQSTDQGATQPATAQTAQDQVNSVLRYARGDLSDLDVPDNLQALVGNDCDGDGRIEGIGWFGPINVRFGQGDGVFLIDAMQGFAASDGKNFDFYTDAQHQAPLEQGLAEILRTEKLSFDMKGLLFIVKRDDLIHEKVRSVNYSAPQLVQGVTWFGAITVSFDDSKKVFLIGANKGLSETDKSSFGFFADDQAAVQLDMNLSQKLQNESLGFDTTSKVFSLSVNDLSMDKVKSVRYLSRPR